MLTNEIIIARRFDTDQPVRVTLTQNAISKIEVIDDAPQDCWIAPSLFDAQVNGFAGVDFQSDSLTENDLLAAVRGLRRSGCGQFFLTLVTDEWPTLLERLEHLRSLRDRNAELHGAISGWHIEGPFLCAESGYHGAHNPQLMLDPTDAHIWALRAAAGNDALLITVAPERAGAIEAIKLAASLKIVVSLGHTNASVETIAQAVQAGATGFTHLGNGCAQALDRHDNIVWRVCDTPGLIASLIPDSHHVSPMLFRLLSAALPRERICYTTDAMSAAGAPPGRYRLGKMEVDVGAERIVRQPGKSNFAGSALTPLGGIFTAAKMLNCSWRDTWFSMSMSSRKYANVSRKAESMPFCILKMEGNEFKSGRLFADGVGYEIDGESG